MKEEKERTPLKTILQNFLNHVGTLEAKKGERDDQYEKEFQSLKGFSDELKSQTEFSSSEGDRDVNRKKNRYKDILPFNYTRVLLSDYPGVPGSDYINANYIKGASGSNAYIACQGPLPHTVNDFWRMVVECEVQVIVMACNEQEGGKHKCECYWTPDDQGEKQFGKFFVSLLKSREICPDFLVRTMRLEWAGEGGKQEERTVCQFHYSAWPDHGIPTQVKPLLEMVRLIRDCQASETLPVLIHCSAGCGRTGTICAIDFVWGLLRTGKLSGEFSLYELVKDMRRQRIAMVQTVEQYVLCHRAVKELFLEQLRVIDSHPYENVGDDGRPLAGPGEDAVTPDYETIFIKGQGGQGDVVDIESVLSVKVGSMGSMAPRTVMGTAMLAREKSPNTVASTNGASSESTGSGGSSEDSGNLLPTTLDDLRTSPRSSGNKLLLDPAKVPDANKETGAPQRFKKGNLRLLQTDDGGWKLEEQEGKLRKLSIEEAGKTSEKKPPPAEGGKKDKKKKHSKGEEASKENQLLRRPSMKKIKAFFDSKNKDESKEEKENENTNNVSEDKSDSDYVSAISKMPKFEPDAVIPSQDQVSSPECLPNVGSKSVPSSLDRKSSKSRESDYSQVGSLDAKRDVEKNSNNNLTKYWPLGRSKDVKQLAAKSQSSERLPVGEKPTLPIKRSKSMKAVSKPVSVIPILSTRDHEASFGLDEDRYDEEPTSPGGYDTYPKTKPRSENRHPDELIDLTRTSLDSSHVRQGSGEEKQTYHFGERDNCEPKSGQVGALGPAASTGPPKPKRDWSVVNHDYANVRKGGDYSGLAPTNEFQGLTSGADFIDPTMLDKESIRSQLRDYVNIKLRRERGSSHPRQGSGDSAENKEAFLEQQMAKLQARMADVKDRDETDSGNNSSSNSGMKRSKSSDLPRPENLSLVRSQSGEWKKDPGIARSSEILDEDAKKMLKDCQEYLLGAFDMAERESGLLGSDQKRGVRKGATSAENSPLGTLSKGGGGLSVHSSPGNSYNKYNSLKSNKSFSGIITTSPPGTIQKSVSSPTGTIQKNFCSPATKPQDSPSNPNKTMAESLEAEARRSEDGGSEAGGEAKLSPSSEAGEDVGEVHDYENVDTHNIAVEARGKLSAAGQGGVRTRERRNSYREAVDRTAGPTGQEPENPEAAAKRKGPRNAYEAVWFGEDGDLEPDSLDASAGSRGLEASAGSRGLEASAGSRGLEVSAGGSRGLEVSSGSRALEVSAGSRGLEVSAVPGGTKQSPRGGGIDTRKLADGPVYANTGVNIGKEEVYVNKEGVYSNAGKEGVYANAGKEGVYANAGVKEGGKFVFSGEQRMRAAKPEPGSRVQAHIRSGSYDNIPTPGGPNSGEPTSGPPSSDNSGYEVVSFGLSSAPGSKKNSLDKSQSNLLPTTLPNLQHPTHPNLQHSSHPNLQPPTLPNLQPPGGLQSVGLVAEACRDYERHGIQKPVLSKQNSGSNLRGPPPYQAPPPPGGTPPSATPHLGYTQPNPTMYQGQGGDRYSQSHPPTVIKTADIRYNRDSAGPQVEHHVGTPKRHPPPPGNLDARLPPTGHSTPHHDQRHSDPRVPNLYADPRVPHTPQMTGPHTPLSHPPQGPHTPQISGPHTPQISGPHTPHGSRHPSPRYQGPPPPYPNNNQNNPRLDMAPGGPRGPRTPGGSSGDKVRTPAGNSGDKVRTPGDRSQEGTPRHGQVTRRQPREMNRHASRDDSDLPRGKDEHAQARHMKRNSSLVTTTRLGLADYQSMPTTPGLPGKCDPPKGILGMAGQPIIVQGARTAVMVGGGHSPPGVDVDHIAASMTNDKDIGSSPSAPPSKHFSRSLAGVLGSAADKIKSRLTGIGDTGVTRTTQGFPGGDRGLGSNTRTTPPSQGSMGRTLPPRTTPPGVSRATPSNVSTPLRATPSPPTRLEGGVSHVGERSPALIPLSVPGADLHQREYGYPIRLDKRPVGPRETPGTFHKKQEYL